MQLSQPLVKLPIRFDAEALAADVNALPLSAWVLHPSGYAGNEAVRLITPGGGRSDRFRGPMQPTEYLAQCPYIKQAMAALGGVWGRSRLMALAPGSEVPPHVDAHYHWRTHLRIHVPVVTNPDVHFTCGGDTVHMAAGECWVFDSFRLHEVHNRGDERRVHLVLDTLVSERLWDLIDAAQIGENGPGDMVRPGAAASGPLLFEQFNLPEIMSPWEIRGHVAFAAGEAKPHPALDTILKRLDRFIDAWSALWAQFGPSDESRPAYLELADRTRSELQSLGLNQVKLNNDLDLAFVLDKLVFHMAVAEPAAAAAEPAAARVEPAATASAIVTSAPRAPVPPAALAGPTAAGGFRDRIVRPIFIISSPRSGSTLLFETLAKAPDVYTIGGESHRQIEGQAGLSPRALGWHSNRLTAEHAEPERNEHLAHIFYEELRNRDEMRPNGSVRMLEKTPKNALRIPFLNAAWPDATFVYLYRDARQTLASMIEVWESGRFRTYPGLPGWQGIPWSLLLIPGWRQLIGSPLPAIVAEQWKVTTQTLLDDFAAIPRERVRAVNYEDFIAAPSPVIAGLANSLDLEWDRPLGPDLPLSKYTVSPPRADKWRAISEIIEEIWPVVEETDARARAFVDSLH